MKGNNKKENINFRAPIRHYEPSVDIMTLVYKTDFKTLNGVELLRVLSKLNRDHITYYEQRRHFSDNPILILNKLEKVQREIVRRCDRNE